MLLIAAHRGSGAVGRCSYGVWRCSALFIVGPALFVSDRKGSGVVSRCS